MDSYEMRTWRETLRDESLKSFTAMLTLAGFTIERQWELANGYWPLSPDYDDIRQPWWLFKTQVGLIQVGRRKRVIHIEWYHVDAIVTEDRVTKDERCVHAWSDTDAVTYLKALLEASKKAA